VLGGAGGVWDNTPFGQTAAIYAISGVPYVDTSAKEKTAFFGNNGIGTQKKTPTSKLLTGSLTGEIFIDDDYIYVCHTNGNLKRVPITSW